MSDIVLVETIAPHYKIDWLIVNEDSVMVDVGFTNGDVYNELRKRFGGLICGIEPNPICTDSSEYRNLKFSRKALVGNNHNDKIEFYQCGSCAGGIMKDLYPSHYHCDKVIEVETLKIKDLFTEFGIDHIDWFKLHTVGAEWEIMNDMSQDMADKIYQINVQNYYIQLKDDELPDRMNNRLRELGFRTSYPDNPGPKDKTIIYGTREKV